MYSKVKWDSEWITHRWLSRQKEERSIEETSMKVTRLGESRLQRLASLSYFSERSVHCGSKGKGVGAQLQGLVIVMPTPLRETITVEDGANEHAKVGFKRRLQGLTLLATVVPLR